MLYDLWTKEKKIILTTIPHKNDLTQSDNHTANKLVVVNIIFNKIIIRIHISKRTIRWSHIQHTHKTRFYISCAIVHIQNGTNIESVLQITFLFHPKMYKENLFYLLWLSVVFSSFSRNFMAYKPCANSWQGKRKKKHRK